MAKKNNKKEVAELEKSYESIAGKKNSAPSAGKGRIAAMIGGSIAITLILAALAVLYFFPDLLIPQRITVNLHIAGVDVTGMTKQQAITAVTEATENTYSQNTMVLTAGEHTVELTPEMTGITLDVEAAVSAACKLTSDTQHMDLTPYLTINESVVKGQLDIISKSNESTLTQSTYEVVGSFDPVEGTTDMELVVLKGQAGINSDVDMIYTYVLSAYSENRFQVEYPLQIVEPETLNFEEIKNTHGVEPVNAVMDMETFEVSDHTYGCTFNIEKAEIALSAAGYNEEIRIPFQIVEPEETKEEVASILFRDILGSYTAHSSSKPYTRDVNLRISCQKIDGTVLMPGDVFDYNAALGERTAAGGWQKADGYENGDTISVYGGGICQASSALYYCTLIADLEIVTRTNHSYISSYMPLGMDATVSWGGPHFRFKNNTEYPIRIEASASGGSVTVQLVGTDTKDYYVKMEYEVLKRTPFETVYKEVTQEEAEDFKDGDVMVSGYVGHKVVTYKCKYSKETDELISREEEAISTYKKRDKVICKIVEAPTESTNPDETVPDITNPDVTEPETTVPETDPPTETTTPVPEETIGGVVEEA